MPRSDTTLRASASLVLLAGLLSLASTRAHAKAERPDPLAAEAGCERYRGQALGANDASQIFELVVCTTPEGVRAKVQTSSLVSGWSVRRATGSWDAAGQVLTLAETEFLESRPEPGWYFCLIDELLLTKTEAGLSGSYVSKACDDRAQLVLEAIVPAGVEPTAVTTAEPSPPAPPLDPAPADLEPPSRGCACTVGASSARSTALLPIIVLMIGAARARRRAR